MADNGNMLMFETDGDTMVNTFKSDYANNFRKAFAHEGFGYLRSGDDGEEREIENPRLSTVLSGTPEQVKSLIHDAENGLLSRFMFFCINSTPEWLDGFDSYGGDDPLEDSFDAIGQEFTASRRFLSRLHVSNSLYPFHRQASSTISLRQKKSECMSSMGTVTLPAHIAWPGASSV